MTSFRLVLVAALGLSSAAMAQTPPVRSPVSGDPVAQAPKPVQPKPLSRAARNAQADKQPPGTENGNQPDRASAGGGGR